VHLLPGSRIAAVYGRDAIQEGYHCRYGLGSGFREALGGRNLHISAVDDQDDARALELDGHPFFVATLFQHERAALNGVCPPLAKAFLQAASEMRIGKAA
jgi:CTP synthase (UTP-ammonia lyase)